MVQIILFEGINKPKKHSADYPVPIFGAHPIASCRSVSNPLFEGSYNTPTDISFHQICNGGLQNRSDLSKQYQTRVKNAVTRFLDLLEVFYCDRGFRATRHVFTRQQEFFSTQSNIVPNNIEI